MSAERRSKSTVKAEPSLGEVEELLRAAQDDLLLKLSVDTHPTSRRPALPSSSSPFSSSSSSSSTSLDPDLSRRFDALRSHRAPGAPNWEPRDAPSNLRDGGGGAAPAAAAAAAARDETRGGRSEGDDEVSKILGDDLAARFAALKDSSSSYLPAGNVARKPSADGDADSDESDDDDDDDDGGVSKKEVEKLMQWAMDAARLDPDPSNSDDEEGIGKEEEEEEEGASEQDDIRGDAAAKAAEGKKPPSAGKWFFF